MATVVKADKEEEEVNTDSLEKDLEKEELLISRSRLFNPFPANASGNPLPHSFYDLLHVGPLHTKRRLSAYPHLVARCLDNILGAKSSLLQ